MRSSFLLVVIEVTPVSFAIFLSSARVSPASWLNPSLGCWWRICPRSLRCISGCGASPPQAVPTVLQKPTLRRIPLPLLRGAVFCGGLLGFFRLRGCRPVLRAFGSSGRASPPSSAPKMVSWRGSSPPLRGVRASRASAPRPPPPLARPGLRPLLFSFFRGALRLFFALRRSRFSCVASFLFDLRLFAVRSLRGRGLRFSRRLFDGLALRPCSSLYAGRFVV